MSSISSDRWRQLSPLLDNAIEMDAVERSAWLESLRSEDPDLAADIELLLEEHELLSKECFLDQVAALPPEPSLKGQVIGAYTLLSPIGQGGMGNVWLAERSDGRFESRVALKFLNAALIGGAGGERFRREGSILARLVHPHVTRLLDAGVSQIGQPYLVIEHVEGDHIDLYCDAKDLGTEARVRLFLDVLDAVAHAHANLIVHRDIKPSNVLVTPEGQVKLLDFGIAKLLENTADAGAATALTREAGGALTPEYAAPEQVTGGAITTATDIYSSGVLLFLLLGGQRKTGSPAETMLALVDATEFPKLTNVPADLATIVAKALKKNSGERYSSATAFAEDLRRYLDHEPISARPDNVLYRVSKFLRRHWKGVTAVAALLLAASVLVGFYTARLAMERNRARLEAAKASKVSDLLIGMLTASDPYVAHDVKEPTVRSLLDAGAARVHKELASQPEVQAQMLTVIGRVYQRLGERDKARPLLEEAVAIRRRQPESEGLAQSVNDLGVLYRENGDSAAAERLLTEALAMRRRLLGPEHPDVAVTLVDLARVYTDHGNNKRAEPLLREALRIRRKVLGEANTETATSLNDLAVVLWDQGDLAGAAPLFRQAVEIYRKAGDDGPSIASVMGNLALVTEDLGDLPGSISLFREALAIKRRTLDKGHPQIAVSLNNLSHPLRVQGKYDEAASLLREALDIARPVLGDDHPVTAAYMLNLARVELLQGQAAAAEPLARHGLEVRRQTFHDDDWHLASAKSLLGGILLALGRYNEAKPLLLEAQKVLKDVPGSQGEEARANRDRLAALNDATNPRR